MIQALLASQNKTLCTDMVELFAHAGIHIIPVHSGALAFTMISDTPYELLITDEQLPDMSGKRLIEKSITHNPFINCAVISRLSKKEFHEKFEGLGILMQLPQPPDTKHAQELLNQMGKVSSLLKDNPPKTKEVTTP